jgi:hypothetical protein
MEDECVASPCPHVPYQFLHIEGEPSAGNSGLHSDHQEGRYNLETSILWFAMMQPGRDQSPRFTHQCQHSQHRFSDKNRADICPRATNVLIKIDIDSELFSGSERLRISLQCPNILKICGINCWDWTILRSCAIDKVIENRRHSISGSCPTGSPTLGDSNWCGSFARTRLGLCGPAPARNRQQEKQRTTVKKTRIGNGRAARNTHEGRNLVKCGEHSKEQREDSADQA